MKNCTYCAYAEWKKTATGRLHPSGDGFCTYPYKVPELPQSKFWIGMNEPKPSGGNINRRNDLKKHCKYFTWAQIDET